MSLNSGNEETLQIVNLSYSLNITRVHQIVRPNSSFHTFLLSSPIVLTPRD